MVAGRLAPALPPFLLVACALLISLPSAICFTPSCLLPLRTTFNSFAATVPARRHASHKRAPFSANLRCSSKVQAEPQQTISYTVQDFFDSFSGEWIGYESEYRADSGDLVPVPEYQLPEELVEWGEVVKSYEHLSSSTASAEGIRIKRSRLLPSCGCGVDAVPTDKFTVEASFQEGVSSAHPFEGGALLTVDSSGREPRWTVVLPASEEGGEEGGEGKRVQVAGRGVGEDLRTVQVFVEERIREYQDGSEYWEIFRDPQYLKRMERPDLSPCSPSSLSSLSLLSSPAPLLPSSSSPDPLVTLEPMETAFLPSGVTVRRFASEEAGAGGVQVGVLTAGGERRVLAWEWRGGKVGRMECRVEG